MQRIWFFDFETRTWSSRIATGGSTEWTFGHAIKRGRHMYMYGTHHPVSTEESLASVGSHGMHVYTAERLSLVCARCGMMHTHPQCTHWALSTSRCTEFKPLHQETTN